MVELASINDCCGCAACVDSCNQGAIELIEDRNGFYFPKVNDTQCVNCGKCIRACHILNPIKKVRTDYKTNPYAAWSLDEEILKKSASGGIFAQVAYNFLKQEGAFVYGASIQEDSSVHHIEISSGNDLWRLQNSKYQQSNCTGIYKKVKERLKHGSYVLFSGTPCEIAALYIYLGNNKNLIEHLYTIEVICHGVPSNKIHRMGLKYSGAKRIVSYRTKSQGWLNGNRLVYDFGKDGIKECSNRREDFIFRSYLSFFMSFYRKSCFKCPYASIHRVADLTLGDYWGYDKKKYENYYGVSLVLVNSFKGEALFCDAENINQIPTTWAECLPHNQNLFMPTNKYLFIASDYIHSIEKLPDIIKKFIFQNGFSNRLLDRLYTKLFNIATTGIRKKKQEEINRRAQKAIQEVSA